MRTADGKRRGPARDRKTVRLANPVSPLVLLDTHARLRAVSDRIASFLIGPPGLARRTWFNWSNHDERTMLIAPSDDIAAGLNSWEFHVKRGMCPEEPSELAAGGPTLFFDPPTRLAVNVREIFEVLESKPHLAIAVAATASDIEAVLLDTTIAAEIHRFLIAGLVPLTSEDATKIDAIVDRFAPGRGGRPRSHEEAILFGLLERRSTRGLFRLNDRVANYEVDLHYESAQLVVEVDGVQHEHSHQQKRRDRRKEHILRQLGYEIMRISAQEVVSSPDEAWQKVADFVEKRTTGMSR